MSRKRSFFTNSPLFTPSVVRGLRSETAPTPVTNAAMNSGSIQNSTSSFRYDPPGSGVRSTQQIPVDYSKFENHTFFNSAESKVNSAFDAIINRFPFDGTKGELFSFFDELTGYEKHVYDSFPKYTGYLNFSGSSEPATAVDGTYIKIKDVQGALYPSLSKNRKDSGILDPKSKSFCIEGHLFLPEIQNELSSNGNQIIFQKINNINNHGITLAVSSSTSQQTADIVMIVSSGTFHLSASASVPKGQFFHVGAVWNRSKNKNRVELFKDFTLASTSSYYKIGNLNFTGVSALIGTGSSVTGTKFHGGAPFTPSQTFSGSMEELRIWHKTKSQKDLKHLGYSSIFAQKDLMLYLKFNEPTGSHAGSNIVLDSSGNSLHSTVTNYTETLRITGSVTSPMLSEQKNFSPILFPLHHKLVDLNNNLLNSASQFDANNPNLITKLIPRHYLQEAQVEEGLEGEQGNVGSPYSAATDFPGGGKMSSPQIIASLLFTWAKFFDEIKMYLDAYGNVLNVDYVSEGTVSDAFLPFIAEYYGFNLPNMFPDVSLKQYLEGVNINVERSVSANNLQYVQNQIWRRILTDLNQVIRTKGTISSIKAVFANMGISPDKIFRFREYGGIKSKLLSDTREKKYDVTTMVDMSGTLSSHNTPVDPNTGFPISSPFIRSPFLSGSRVEPGVPLAKGIVNSTTGSDEPSDGLFTSGSWSYEAVYKFNSKKHFPTQSLSRLSVTGSYNVDGTYYKTNHLLANLIALSGSETLNQTSSLKLFVNPNLTGSSASEKHLTMRLDGVNIFNGDKWYVSYGRSRPDVVGSLATSSYFLRAGRADSTGITEYFTTKSLYNDHHSVNYFESLSSDHNASGSIITIGSQSLAASTASIGLNNPGHYSNTYQNEILSTKFSGRLARIRFWSKALTEKESKEHTRNFKSLGVEDPKINFNFNTVETGTFERLRLDVSCDQPILTSSANGSFKLIDFSQNNLNFTATGFEVNKNIFAAERFDYSQLSSFFDRAPSPNKIRPRSMQSSENINLYGTVLAPLHEIPASEKPLDDVRFGIEVSSIQALNDDIVKIFASFDAFEEYIGSPELMFSPDYPDLDNLRKIYFNRLTDKINYTQFFQFFKWFDASIGTLIESLIPRKTKYIGTNFVIESHLLERAKFTYNHSGMYMGASNRHSINRDLLVQQLLIKIGECHGGK